jgi:hypothetical protein
MVCFGECDDQLDKSLIITFSSQQSVAEISGKEFRTKTCKQIE